MPLRSSSGNAPNTFELVGTGKLQGRQSINRAELAACVIAIGTFQNISLVCDSAVGVGVLLDGVPARKWVASDHHHQENQKPLCL